MKPSERINEIKDKLWSKLLNDKFEGTGAMVTDRSDEVYVLQKAIIEFLDEQPMWQHQNA